MAGLSQVRGRWRVTTYVKHARKSWEFGSKDAAMAFMSKRGLVYKPRAGNRQRNRAQMIDHLAANFEVSDDGCWLWTGKLTNADYARLTWRWGGAFIPGGHRVVLHAIGQPVPQGLVVDHLCRVRHCINPDHLDVVVQRENVLRSPIAQGALNAAKTHCPQGHPYSPENTYTYNRPSPHKTTTRICKTCAAAHHKRYYQNKKAAVA